MNDLIMMGQQFVCGLIIFFGYWPEASSYKFLTGMMILGLLFNLLIYNSYGDFRKERKEEELKEEIIIQLKGGENNENI